MHTQHLILSEEHKTCRSCLADWKPLLGGKNYVNACIEFAREKHPMDFQTLRNNALSSGDETKIFLVLSYMVCVENTWHCFSHHLSYHPYCEA